MTPEDAERRIRELEEALRRKELEAAMYKDSVHAMIREYVPYTPVTEEEIQRLLTDPPGQPILEIIAEYERMESQT